MARPLWSRALALVAGLWLTVSAVRPELAHACPQHGSDPQSMHAGAHAAAPVAASPVDHSAHHAAPTEAQPAQQPAQPDRDDHCTCVDQCCSSAPVALAGASLALVETITAVTHDRGLPDHEYVPVAAEHILPFAHPPPRA